MESSEGTTSNLGGLGAEIHLTYSLAWISLCKGVCLLTTIMLLPDYIHILDEESVMSNLISELDYHLDERITQRLQGYLQG